jgi:hypothetical protein
MGGVATWGPVAVWVGAGFAGLAIILGLIYYVLDRRREKSSQARFVRFAEDKTHIDIRWLITNNSDKALHDVRLFWRRPESLEEALVDRASRYGSKNWGHEHASFLFTDDAILDRYAKLPPTGPFKQWHIVAPNKTVKVWQQEGYNPTLGGRIILSFTDAGGDRWFAYPGQVPTRKPKRARRRLRMPEGRRKYLMQMGMRHRARRLAADIKSRFPDRDIESG